MEHTDYFVDLSSKLIQNNLDKILSSISKLSKDVRKNIHIKSGKAFQEYFKTAINRYVETKTILYREKPVYIYDFYINVELSDNKNFTILTKDINQIILNGNRILITGIAGCGKSTLLKHLFLNTIETQNFIPIFIELRYINESKATFIDFILKRIEELKFNLEKKYFEKLLESGYFIFLFDGFDEINPKKIDKVTNEIIKLTTKYEKNYYIVSSRPDEKFISWDNFNELKVLPFTKVKSLELINKLDYDIDFKEKFYDIFKKELYNKHQSFLSNPLLVTIMIMTYERNLDIPDKMHLFYEHVFEVLYIRHEVVKGMYRRNMYANLEIDDFKNVLSAFCILSYFNNQINFTETEVIKYLKDSRKITHIQYSERQFFYDLLKSLCLIVQDGLFYTFAHRAFQEYFSALFIIDSKPEQRIELIKKLEPKINLDNTAKIIFEKNRKILEDEYLIERLRYINKKTKYNDTDKEQSFTNYIKLCFNNIFIQDKSIVFGLNQGIYLEITKFVYNNYKRVYKNKSLERLEEEVLKEKMINFKKDFLIKSKLTINELSKINLLNSPLIKNNKQLSTILISFLRSKFFFYEYSMLCLEIIENETRNLEKSIDDLLIK